LLVKGVYAVAPGKFDIKPLGVHESQLSPGPQLNAMVFREARLKRA